MAKPWEGERLHAHRMKRGRSAGLRREEPRLSTVILGLVPRVTEVDASAGRGHALAACPHQLAPRLDLGTRRKGMSPRGDRALSIPVSGGTNPNHSNALQKKQRHRRASIQTARILNRSPSRGGLLVPAQAGDGDGTERGRLPWLGGGLGRRGSEGPKAQDEPRRRPAGRRGREVQTGPFQDQSESPTAPSGRPDPARPRGNVDRDETGPQSPSLEKNGSAERSSQAETQTQPHGLRAKPGPLRASPSAHGQIGVGSHLLAPT